MPEPNPNSVALLAKSHQAFVRSSAPAAQSGVARLRLDSPAPFENNGDMYFREPVKEHADDDRYRRQARADGSGQSPGAGLANDGGETDAGRGNAFPARLCRTTLSSHRHPTAMPARIREGRRRFRKTFAQVVIVGGPAGQAPARWRCIEQPGTVAATLHKDQADRHASSGMATGQTGVWGTRHYAGRGVALARIQARRGHAA